MVQLTKGANQTTVGGHFTVISVPKHPLGTSVCLQTMNILTMFPVFLTFV